MSAQINCKNKNRTEKLALDSTVELTRMKPQDAEEVFQLAEECGLSFWSRTEYELEVHRKDSFITTAKRNNKTIGFIAARLITSLIADDFSSQIFQAYENQLHGSITKQANENDNRNSENEAEIYNLAVRSDCRRTGVAGILIESLFNHLRGIQNVSASMPFTVWLEVRESNTSAIKFYQTHGFILSHKRKNFYSFPNEDALILKTVVDSIML